MQTFVASVSTRTAKVASSLRVLDAIAATQDTSNSKATVSNVFQQEMPAKNVRTTRSANSARLVTPLESSHLKMMDQPRKSVFPVQLMMGVMSAQITFARHASLVISLVRITFATSVELIKMAVTNVTI
jgi:hypothetical protein